jgi:hypothetical protein
MDLMWPVEDMQHYNCLSAQHRLQVGPNPVVFHVQQKGWWRKLLDNKANDLILRVCLSLPIISFAGNDGFTNQQDGEVL